MSRRPKWSWACLTAAKSAARSVTSNVIGRIASPNLSTRSSRVAVSRAVAATLSPRSSAAIAHSRPKPREVPVMNQVFWAMRSLPGVDDVRSLATNPEEPPVFRGRAVSPVTAGPLPGRLVEQHGGGAGRVERAGRPADRDAHDRVAGRPPGLTEPAGLVPDHHQRGPGQVVGGHVGRA